MRQGVFGSGGGVVVSWKKGSFLQPHSFRRLTGFYLHSSLFLLYCHVHLYALCHIAKR